MKKAICSTLLGIIVVACIVLLVGCVYLLVTLPAEPPVLDPDEPLPFLMHHDATYLKIYIISLALILVGFLLLFVFHKTTLFYVLFIAAAIIAGITSRDANFLIIFISMAAAFFVSFFSVKHGGYDY